MTDKLTPVCDILQDRSGRLVTAAVMPLDAYISAIIKGMDPLP